MDGQTALTPESFSILAVFLRADIVVKVVIVGLALCSLLSWTILITKIFEFASLNRDVPPRSQRSRRGRNPLYLPRGLHPPGCRFADDARARRSI